MSEPIETGTEGQRSVSDMVKNIMDTRQLNVSEVAEFLDRDPRMVRKLLKGESKGESFRESLEELETKGTVSKPPPRRRDKEGNTVPVRDKQTPDAPKRFDPKTGRELAPVKVPTEQREGRYTDRRPESYRARKWATKTGDKRMRVDMPPKDAEAEQKGMQALHKQVRGTARSQAHKNKQMKFEVTLDTGRKIELFAKGGLNASNVLRRVNKDFGGDIDAFLRDQMGKNTKSGPAGHHKIASISLQTFDAKTPKKK